jgi:NAD(P)-dependent dehydrogenase (short-subunit alcohol dehydrogenase family)
MKPKGSQWKRAMSSLIWRSTSDATCHPFRPESQEPFFLLPPQLAIFTERQKQLWFTEAYKAEIFRRQALKRMILPEEVARLVLFLAADDSGAITSQSYVIDGGWV